MKRQVLLKKSHHFLPHQELYEAARFQLDAARIHKGKPNHPLLSCLVMCAFAFEAYMNYVGPRVESGWEDFDKASPLGKFRHIALILSLPADFSHRPLQTINGLVSFRNGMAHPREERVTEETLVESEDREAHNLDPVPKCRRFASLLNAERCYEDVGDVMRKIERAAQKRGVSFMMDGWSLFSESRPPVSTPAVAFDVPAPKPTNIVTEAASSSPDS